jgi:hypothetical protein
MILKGALDAARQSCDTAELTVYAPLAAVDLLSSAGPTRSQRLRESADMATAAAKGTSVEEERETYVAQPRFDLFATSATSIPEGATYETHPGAYSAEILRVNEVRAAAVAEPEAAIAELMARVEDPTAVSAIPPVVTMGSQAAAGYGKNGAASRRGQAPLRIGPARGRGAFFLTAQDEFEEEYGVLARAHLERIRAEALAKHPGVSHIAHAYTAADVRSWDKLLDARDLAEARVASAEAALAGAQAQVPAAVTAAAAELEAADRAASSVRAVVDEQLGAVRYPAGALLHVRSPYAYFDFQSSLIFFPPAIARLDVVTDTASVVLKSSLGQTNFMDPDTDCLSIVSNTGDVNVSSMVVPGISIETAGDAFLLGLASAEFTLFPPPPALSGKKAMNTHTTATGTLTITEGLGGYVFSASTEEGLLLVYNCAGAVGTTIDFEAKGSADVWFTTMLLAGGNITAIKTNGGTTHANVVYSNRFVIDATAGGSAALVELFLGIAAPRTAVEPPLVGNYTNPGLLANHPKGSISVTGISGAPASSCPGETAPNFASNLAVELRTTTDPISVQINGGGINAPYKVYSEHGQATMNIIGNDAPLSGVLGLVNEANPSEGYFHATSEYGDIDVVELENSIPDLSSLGIALG